MCGEWSTDKARASSGHGITGDPMRPWGERRRITVRRPMSALSRSPPISPCMATLRPPLDPIVSQLDVLFHAVDPDEATALQ